MTQSQQINTIFGYPTHSTIKKTHQTKNFSENYVSQKQEQNLDDESSIEFQDQEDNYEEDSQNQIQFLEQQITQKLSQQYSFIKSKLKEKEQQKQNLLKYFRDICTFYPKGENDSLIIEEKNQKLNKSKQSNPLNTKKIKDKIVKNVDSNFMLSQEKILYQIQRNHLHDKNSFQNDQCQKTILKNNISTVQKETLKFHNENRDINQKNYDQLRLIQEISDELKKMEFKKIQDIAEGRFNFLKKR